MSVIVFLQIIVYFFLTLLFNSSLYSCILSDKRKMAALILYKMFSNLNQQTLIKYLLYVKIHAGRFSYKISWILETSCMTVIMLTILNWQSRCSRLIYKSRCSKLTMPKLMLLLLYLPIYLRLLGSRAT